MNLLRTFSFLLIVFLVSCGPKNAELAQNKFNHAEKLYSEKNFNDAKLSIDSIIEFFPNEVEFVTRGKDLLRKITIEEQNQNLVFLDSLLDVKEKELEPLMKNFIESSDYGAKKILIHKRQKPENSYGRTYLRAHLDYDGNFFISSRFTSTNRIYHNQIKVYFSGNSAISEKIPEDGFKNRHFEDGENHWEVINFKEGADNGIIDFIAANSDQSLKVQFIGKKHHYILMEKFDKEAIRDGYEISFVIKEVKKVKEEIKKANDELKRLNSKSE